MHLSSPSYVLHALPISSVYNYAYTGINLAPVDHHRIMSVPAVVYSVPADGSNKRRCNAPSAALLYRPFRAKSLILYHISTLLVLSSFVYAILSSKRLGMKINSD